MLVLCSGLPGSGKSTLSTWLATQVPGVLLSIDVIEAALYAGGVQPGSGMETSVPAVVNALATHHLALGHTVIVDTVLEDESQRTPFRALAEREATSLAVIEVVCSDRMLHRAHYMSRPPLVPYHSHDWGHVERVEARYQPWTDERLVVDAVSPVTVNGPKAEAYLRTKRR